MKLAAVPFLRRTNFDANGGNANLNNNVLALLTLEKMYFYEASRLFLRFAAILIYLAKLFHTTVMFHVSPKENIETRFFVRITMKHLIVNSRANNIHR